MTKEAALAAAATLVAAAFTLSTFDRWLAHRRRHEAAWTIALAMFTIASASLWVAAAVGWTDATFRVFYLFGAILNVPWLALGTIELLGGVRWGRPSVAVVGLLSAFAAGVMAVAPFEAPVPADELPKGSDVLGPLPRILAAVCSGGAALIIIGGALWSAWRLLRGRRRPGSAGRDRRAGTLGARQRDHCGGDAHPVGQRHAQRPARCRDGVRGDPGGRRGGAVRRVPGGHQRLRAPYGVATGPAPRQRAVADPGTN